MTHDRIDLEAKLAFLERTVDALSTAMHEQAKTLDAFERRLARLEVQKRAASEPEVGPHDAPPPHY
ncbi:MAG: SlyX family protein [Planctomycetes bacterium]|nr:SlyX family protein [Planctomycetota bacterium]